MKPSRDFVITWALIFLFPGAWFTVAALANLAKYVKGLTRLGIVVNLVAGAVLTAVGLTCLLGLDRPWIHVSGFVMEGTGRLSFPRHSVTMQGIFMAGGLVLLAFLAFALTQRYYIG